jgi:hypothetical protein
VIPPIVGVGVVLVVVISLLTTTRERGGSTKAS